MKFDSKLNLKNTNTKNVFILVSRVWENIHMLVFFLVLFAFITIGGYVWRQNINYGEWSSEKKQEYMNTQNKEVIFKESDFQKVLDGISLREEENLKEYQPIKDIFKPY